jgi:hypothetical protein
MFTIHPYEHLENTNERVTSDIFVALGECSGHHLNLCPEPLQKVRDGGVGVGGEIHASPPPMQPLMAPYHAEAQPFFTQQVLDPLSLSP